MPQVGITVEVSLLGSDVFRVESGFATGRRGVVDKDVDHAMGLLDFVNRGLERVQVCDVVVVEDGLYKRCSWRP